MYEVRIEECFIFAAQKVEEILLIFSELRRILLNVLLSDVSYIRMF